MLHIGGRSLAVALQVSLSLGVLVTLALPAAAQEAPTHSGFNYGVILTALDNAPAARDGGFTLMSAFVAWENVEPARGQFVFEQQDK